jgi:hypothetical protein
MLICGHPCGMTLALLASHSIEFFMHTKYVPIREERLVFIARCCDGDYWAYGCLSNEYLKVRGLFPGKQSFGENVKRHFPESKRISMNFHQLGLKILSSLLPYLIGYALNRNSFS